MSDETMARAGATHDVATLTGRVLLSLIFIWSGYAKLMAPAATQVYFANLGLPAPMLVWIVAVAIEFFGGLALLLGVQTRVVGSILAAWCVATALVAHTNFADRNMQIHFLKNIAMAGGFLYVAAFGAGTYSVQQVFRRRARAT